MVLHTRGRVGSRRFSEESSESTMTRGSFLLYDNCFLRAVQVPILRYFSGKGFVLHDEVKDMEYHLIVAAPEDVIQAIV